MKITPVYHGPTAQIRSIDQVPYKSYGFAVETQCVTSQGHKNESQELPGLRFYVIGIHRLNTLLLNKEKATRDWSSHLADRPGQV